MRDETQIPALATGAMANRSTAATITAKCFPNYKPKQITSQKQLNYRHDHNASEVFGRGGRFDSD